MGAAERLIRKINALEKAINPSIKESIDRNKGVLIDDQTDQMDSGKDSLNISFVPSYADSTKQYKRRKGQPTNRVTLKDTGDLYRSIQIDTTTTQAIITANVEYFKYLVTHYENNVILGIQSDLMKDFIIKYTKPILKQNWQTIISR